MLCFIQRPHSDTVGGRLAEYSFKLASEFVYFQIEISFTNKNLDVKQVFYQKMDFMQENETIQATMWKKLINLVKYFIHSL